MNDSGNSPNRSEESNQGQTSPAATLAEKLAVCEQVAKLVRARLPIGKELRQSLSSSNTPTRKLAEQIEQDVQSGKKWSDTLVAGRDRESRVLAACIEAGESSDRLAESLQAWTAMHIANSKAKQNFRSALLYPFLLVLLMVIALTMVAWSLIPEYRETYRLFNQNLPRWLEAIVVVGESPLLLTLFLVLFVSVPLAILYWMRRRRGLSRANRDKHAKSLRQQALATHLAALLAGSKVALEKITHLSLRTLGATDEESQLGWQQVQQKQTPSLMPKETSLILGSAHAGLLSPEESAQHLKEVSQNLQQSAEQLDDAHRRWFPMLIALLVGSATILSYVFLIFLPWIWLLETISLPEGINSL